jgi:hypothetical protein
MTGFEIEIRRMLSGGSRTDPGTLDGYDRSSGELPVSFQERTVPGPSGKPDPTRMIFWVEEVFVFTTKSWYVFAEVSRVTVSWTPGTSELTDTESTPRESCENTPR